MELASGPRNYRLAQSAQHVPLPMKNFWEVELAYSPTDAAQGRSIQITTGSSRRSPRVNGYDVKCLLVWSLN